MKRVYGFVTHKAEIFCYKICKGSWTNLSNHAFGVVLTLMWHGIYRKLSCSSGLQGSVRELVSLANENGFYWGGHFERLDGMHFEIAKIM